MSNQPLVSIIIPCYNAERYVAEAIQSALDQTYPSREVIVIDDGSTDNSLETIKSFGNQIRWEAGPNRGGCAARNRGLELAKGKWIQFLDADDLITADKIEKQLLAAQNQPTKLILSCQWKRFRDQPFDGHYPIESKHMPLQPSQWLIQKYSGCGMMPIHAWLTPIGLINKAGGWDESLTCDQDGEFFDHIVSLADKIIHVPDTMAFYRSGLEGSISSGKDIQAFKSRLISIQRGTSRLLALDSSEAAQQACARSILRIAYESYPQFPDISKEALNIASQLPPVKTPVSGGCSVKIVQKVLGWKAARHCQRLIQKYT